MSEVMRAWWTALSIGLVLAGACSCNGAAVSCDAKTCQTSSGVACRCPGALTVNTAGRGMGTGGTAGEMLASSDVEVTGAARDSIVNLGVGQTLTLTLQTIGPGEYGDPVLSSAVVVFDGEQPAPLQNPGGPLQVYRFHGVAIGSALITIPHSMLTTPFTFTVHVQ
jgi:hypothetical protein